MIDCSHANSNKDHRLQPSVFSNVLKQVLAGERVILGMMLESFLLEGKQSLSSTDLCYGQSITDACMNWETTEGLLREGNDAMSRL